MVSSPRGTSPTRRRGASPTRGRSGKLSGPASSTPPLALRLPLLQNEEQPPSPPPPPYSSSKPPRLAALAVVGIALAAAAAGGAAGVAFAGARHQQRQQPPPPPTPAAPLAAAAAPPPPPLLRPPPHVIAHRGASGLLPEHTLPAYAAAIAAGADMVECDVHLTADLQPICRHDPDLATTTDALARFPERARTRVVDGQTLGPGVFACDLTLAEARTLRAKQRWPADRGSQHDGAYGVATLQELLALVDALAGAVGAGGGAASSSGSSFSGGSASPDSPAPCARVIGVYPETKHAAWHDEVFSERWRRRDARLLAGLSALEEEQQQQAGGGKKKQLQEDRSNGRRLLERVVASRLVAAGYAGRGPIGSDSWRARPALVQSFELESLRAVAWLAGEGVGGAAAGGGGAAAVAAGVAAGAAESRADHKKAGGGGGGAASAASASTASWSILRAKLPPVLPRAQKGANALPLVLLLGGWPGWQTPDTRETVAQQLGRMERTWAREVDGAGPWKELLFELPASGSGDRHTAAAAPVAPSAATAAAHGGDVAAAEAEAEAAAGHEEELAPPKPSGLLERLKAAGLAVHAYSVRAEPRFVLPGFAGSAAREMGALFGLGRGGGGLGVGGRGGGVGGGSSPSHPPPMLDGAFADFPAAMVGFLVGEGMRVAS
jgi:glycerophosphoryl diester phosphodiesterase